MRSGGVQRAEVAVCHSSRSKQTGACGREGPRIPEAAARPSKEDRGPVDENAGYPVLCISIEVM